jgi:hypothetical protein
LQPPGGLLFYRSDVLLLFCILFLGDTFTLMELSWATSIRIAISYEYKVLQG